MAQAPKRLRRKRERMQERINQEHRTLRRNEAILRGPAVVVPGGPLTIEQARRIRDDLVRLATKLPVFLGSTATP